MLDDLTRRQLLRRGGGLVVAASGWTVLRGTSWANTPAARRAPFSNALTFPRTITSRQIDLPIVKADIGVLPGKKTPMWTFDGSFPGPTIRRPAGATTKVRFDHRIPEAGDLSIHHHGHHTQAKDDGQPVGESFAPGSARSYTYRHVEEGKPLRGAMRFYHDHTHGKTGRNTWRGLLGLFIIEDELDKELRLPAGEQELLLVIAERQIDPDTGLLADPFTYALDPGADAIGTGELILVNGVVQPHHVVKPWRYRLRVLNASNVHSFHLQFADDGPQLTLIGTESGLLPRAVKRKGVELGPAERADLIVDFTGRENSDLVLVGVAPSTSGPAANTTTTLSDGIMQFRVREVPKVKAGGRNGKPKRAKGKSRRRKPVRKTPKRPVDRSVMPTTLRPLPEWVDDLSEVPQRMLVFGQGVDPSTAKLAWTVNGRVYGSDHVELRPELGSVESWLLVNATQSTHYVHLHDVDWKVVSRNGKKPSLDAGDPEAGLKETFRLDPGELLVVGTKFTDYTGPYMVHCHMLNHEDHAMMTTFEVMPTGAGDPVPADLYEGLGTDIALAVRGMQRQQVRTPGRPAMPPSGPFLLDAEQAQRALLCQLDGTTS